MKGGLQQRKHQRLRSETSTRENVHGMRSTVQSVVSVPIYIPVHVIYIRNNTGTGSSFWWTGCDTSCNCSPLPHRGNASPN